MDDFKEEGISRDLRELAYSKRLSYFENLENYLLDFEKQLVLNQFDFDWASDEQTLSALLTKLLPENSYNRVYVDAHSVPNAFLNQGDLVQQCKLEDVLSGMANPTLIVDADFAVVETGELVFLNRNFTGCFNQSKNLIVIVNIDQVLVSHDDISLFSSIKSLRLGLVPDISILQHPYKTIVADDIQDSNSLGYSAENAKVHVVFYVNNIIPLLSNIGLRDALYCVNCGLCSKVCPLSSAEHPVSPIDLIKNNYMAVQQGARQLFQQTTLCGNCQQSCPANIPLTDLLLYEMQISNQVDRYSKNKRLFSIFSKRSKMNKINSRFLKWWFVRRFFGKNSVLRSYFNQQNSEFYNILTEDSDNQDGQ